MKLFSLMSYFIFFFILVFVVWSLSSHWYSPCFIKLHAFRYVTFDLPLSADKVTMEVSACNSFGASRSLSVRFLSGALESYSVKRTLIRSMLSFFSKFRYCIFNCDQDVYLVVFLKQWKIVEDRWRCTRRSFLIWVNFLQRYCQPISICHPSCLPVRLLSFYMSVDKNFCQLTKGMIYTNISEIMLPTRTPQAI